MSFLTPLYIAGTLFVALPIIFHLIRRTPRDRVPFSSLMFLRESPPRVSRRSRLENLVLLLLRGVALTLLACAFARPFLREPFRAEAEPSDVRVIAIALDTSASMRRDDLWKQTVSRAARALEELRPIDHASVLTFDRQVRTIITFDEWLEIPPTARAKRVKDQLESIEPSWSSTHLGAALAAAADAVDSHSAAIASSATVPDQRVILISDMQKGSDLSGLRQYEWPKRVSAELATVIPRRRTNAAIHLVEERDETKDPGSSHTLRVRITSAADSKRDQFRVHWVGSDNATIEIYLPPGKSRVVSVPQASTASAGNQLILEGDEQEFDNILYVVPRRLQSVSVLFLGGGPAEDTKNLMYYFERAFPKTPWRSVQVLARERGDRLSRADLSGIRFAVLSDPVPNESADLLREFVETGGSLLCVITSAAVAESIGRVIAVDDWVVEEAMVREYAMLGDIDFQHPLFAPFSDARYGDFTKIHFWRHRRAQLEPLHGARVLARFDDHDPALIEVPHGHGRVFLLTAGWHPQDSQLAVSSKFVPLLGGMLDLAISAREAALSTNVDDPMPLDERNPGPTRIRRPDGSEIELPPGSREFRGTTQPGIYNIEGGATLQPFAVNMHPSESQTDALPIEELEQLGVRLTSVKSSSRIVADAQRQMHAFELESRQKLWRWLIVGVLAVLLIESWLAGKTGISSPAS